MSAKFDAMAAQRDPLYAATLPQRNMSLAIAMDRSAEKWPDLASRCREIRDATLLRLAIRTLVAQGEPYYTHKEVTP